MFILVACSDNNRDNSTNSDDIDEVNASTQLLEDKTTQIDKLEKQNEELQADLDNIQTDFNYKKEEADYYKQLIDDLIKGYSNAQLKDLAIKLWDYELEINGVTVPPNGIVEIHETAIEISLMERQPVYLVLPNKITMQGQINGNYPEHITMNSKPTETYFTDGTVVTGIHHKFVGVEEGSTISFTITEELKKRLGLETTQITINNR
ncbi:hypothetical protein LZ480_15865 [Solibacillus sp. MA9]|uniref:Uncharacterized protein n=1 Tax=Solibacillus palustris TaxID=2908203 RepID=A0ABS9UGA0_9BACL|nr:hypothetical protein [Solibacillus sp. MA9]MCH7323352.1 hypothetical protein [Solibacillus sp. MA9]